MRKPHAEKGTTTDIDYATYFRARMNAVPEDYSPELVFNMDETCGCLYETPRRVLDEKGKEAVKLRLHKS
jgi:hypothetical protein